MTLSDRIESLLMSVQKPARYMGGEFNSIMKNPEDVDVRFAFLFPDTYEVGMSHLGMKILYHTINNVGTTRGASACSHHGWTWPT